MFKKWLRKEFKNVSEYNPAQYDISFIDEDKTLVVTHKASKLVVLRREIRCSSCMTYGMKTYYCGQLRSEYLFDDRSALSWPRFISYDCDGKATEYALVPELKLTNKAKYWGGKHDVRWTGIFHVASYSSYSK